MMRRWSYGLCLIGGLMGAAGVALAALGSHRNGGEDARIASEFLLIHAVGLIGLSAMSEVAERAWPWIGAAIVLAFGTIAFSTDLALIGLASWRPVPLAAPVGGFCMILGWVITIFAAASGMLRKK